MSRIIDLTDDDATHEILTKTSLGGLLGGGKLVGGDPLKTYLLGNETAKYVLRNKKSGLSVESDTGTETFTPGDDYKAVALVTDIRILFVLGQAHGDETKEIKLGEIVEAKAESNRLRKSRLMVTTLQDGVWEFPCRNDTTEVAKYIDEMAQIWANASRLLDDADSQATAAEDALTEDDYRRARGELDGAKANIETARQRIREVGQGATDKIEQRAIGLREWVMELKREIYALEGGSAHAQAQRDWHERNYESAAASYDEAIQAYEQALDTDGSRPEREALIERARGAVSERELLRIAPLVDADSARRRAAHIEDPEKAAHQWKDALDSYREMLSLKWGRDEQEFVVEKGTIREQTKAVADDAIEDHHEAGRQWLTSGDKLAVQERREQAREVYERARTQFEQALKLAREVQPEHEDYLESALGTVEERLSGTVPDEMPQEEPLSAAAISGLDDPERQQTDDSADDQAETASTETETVQASSEKQPTETSTEQTQPTAGVSQDGTTASTGKPGATEQGPAETGDSESPADPPGEGTESPESDDEEHGTDESTILGKIQSQKTTETATEPVESQSTQSGTETSSGNHPETTEMGADTTERRDSSQSATNRGEARQERSVSPSDSDRRHKSPEQLSDEQLMEMLRELDEESFTALIADLWEAQGWSTTVFSATAKAVYDIVAMREEPAEERLLVWTVHRADGSEVGGTIVKRCATSRQSSQGADSATLVTTGTLTSAARTRAEEMDVAVVDVEELVHLLRFEELVDKLQSAVGS